MVDSFAHAELIPGLMVGMFKDDRPRQVLAPGNLFRRQHDMVVLQEALSLGGQRQLPEYILPHQAERKVLFIYI